MIFMKKFQLTKAELTQLRRDTEGYVWIAMDIRRHVMAAGSEHYRELKRRLYQAKSRAHDIFGVGLDLKTGEIDYHSPINRKLGAQRPSAFVPYDLIDHINREVYYFFDQLRVIRNQRLCRD
jgi:hypothetical protein